MITPNPLLDSALAHGWHVFPLRPGDKRPAIHGETACPGTGACANGHRGWEQRATTDPVRIHRCWSHAPYNIGIACGPSGLVVIDLDTPKPGQTPPPGWQQPGINDGADVLAALAEQHGRPIPFDTHMVRTASGGLHLYFTAPPGAELRNTSGRLGWLIDTRAHGGYVVAAGSTVAGRCYETVYGIEPTPLPDWLAALLTEPVAVPREPITALARAEYGNPAGYAGAALRSEVQRVLDAVPGTRNHTLNQAAFALGQLAAAGLLPEPLAYDCPTRSVLRHHLLRRATPRGSRQPPPRERHPASADLGPGNRGVARPRRRVGRTPLLHRLTGGRRRVDRRRRPARAAQAQGTSGRRVAAPCAHRAAADQAPTPAPGAVRRRRRRAGVHRCPRRRAGHGHLPPRVGDKARASALSPVEYASPLARRVYDLRHACVSTWLNGGVPPAQVAEWAGHSVSVLLKVYAKCIDGQDETAKRRIEAALQ